MTNCRTLTFTVSLSDTCNSVCCDSIEMAEKNLIVDIGGPSRLSDSSSSSSGSSSSSSGSSSGSSSSSDSSSDSEEQGIKDESTEINVE